MEMDPSAVGQEEVDRSGTMSADCRLLIQSEQSRGFSLSDADLGHKYPWKH